MGGKVKVPKHIGRMVEYRSFIMELYKREGLDEEKALEMADILLKELFNMKRRWNSNLRRQKRMEVLFASVE